MISSTSFSIIFQRVLLFIYFEYNWKWLNEVDEESPWTISKVSLLSTNERNGKDLLDLSYKWFFLNLKVL